MVLCTSNITGAIDVAFVDRADVKQYARRGGRLPFRAHAHAPPAQVHRPAVGRRALRGGALLHSRDVPRPAAPGAGQQPRRAQAPRCRDDAVPPAPQAEFALPPFAALAAPLSSAPTLTLARHVAEAMQLAEVRCAAARHTLCRPAHRTSLRHRAAPQGLSGRALRKLPFRAYAEFIRVRRVGARTRARARVRHTPARPSLACAPARSSSWARCAAPS